MGIEAVYNEILTEHIRSNHNKRKIENPTHTLRGVNPTCGDEITLEVREEDGIIKDAAFTGIGCAISQASTSIMIDLIIDKPLDQALELGEVFFEMIKGERTSDEELEVLEDAIALKNISHMPARVKCAVLSWHTLKEINNK